jgi:hypothetical protein
VDSRRAEPSPSEITQRRGRKHFSHPIRVPV